MMLNNIKEIKNEINYYCIMMFNNIKKIKNEIINILINEINKKSNKLIRR